MPGAVLHFSKEMKNGLPNITRMESVRICKLNDEEKWTPNFQIVSIAAKNKKTPMPIRFPPVKLINHYPKPKRKRKVDMQADAVLHPFSVRNHPHDQ